VVKIVVDVMLKPEIHDPQGEAIAGACHRLGFGDVLSVRQGKRFELEFSDEPAASSAEGTTSAAGPAAVAARVTQLAAELLANPVIEEFTIRSA
jgi:phosphoribosylformylglycinamidine synthase PurS subunit